MATLAQTVPPSPARWAWFQEFFREELSPYPGRKALVARMVMASTLVMIVFTLRSLAQFAREPTSIDLRAAIERSYSLRETINGGFDKVRALADGVLFEFGPTRQQDLALRENIRRWQPQLRLIFVVRIALLKYRLRLPGFELPEGVRLVQQEFDNQLAMTLERLAARTEGKVSEMPGNLEDSLQRLEQAALAISPELPKEAPAAFLQTFLTLSRRIEELTSASDKEIKAPLVSLR